MSETKTKRRRSNKATAAKISTPATPPQVVLEKQTLDGQRLRVVIEHAPGIDYFVVVERFDAATGTWIHIRRPLKETLFSPVNCAMEVAIIQLADKLAKAEAALAQLSPAQTEDKTSLPSQ